MTICRVDRARMTAALVSVSICVSACSTSTSTTTSAAGSPTTQLVASSEPPATTAPTTTAPALITTLPDCDNAGFLPGSVRSGQVGFAAGGAVYIADPNGSAVQCVTTVDAAEPFLWGPAGDRVLAGNNLVTNAGATSMVPMVMPTWSRPTGTSLVWVDNGRLFKTGIELTMPNDISFLARHDAVTYHPAGFEIATTGEAEDGTIGIWLSTNLGEDPRLMVRASEATPHEFAFTQLGTTAYFLADHGDHWHVHDIFLVLPEDNPTANEFDATIAFESKGPLRHLVVSPWEDLWAVEEGNCGAESRVVIGGAGPEPYEVALPDAHPVGWLPNQRLVVAAFPDGCDRRADIWLVDDILQASSSATLLVTDVDAAAVRAAVPDPPSALGDVSLDEFA